MMRNQADISARTPTTSGKRYLRRWGFTLTELLVVMAITLAVAAVTVPVAIQMNDGRRLRDASRSLQAALAGIRERAMSNRAPVGIRLIPDPNDPSIVRSLQIIEDSPPFALGRAIVVHQGWPNAITAGEPIDTVVILGLDQRSRNELGNSLGVTTTGAVTSFIGSIRFGHAGAPMAFESENNNNWFLNTQGGDPAPKLRLVEPLTLPIPFGTSADLSVAAAPQIWQLPNPDNGIEYKIPLGNRVRGAEDPIVLPTGIVIDLGYIPPPQGSAGWTALNPPEQRLTRLRPTFFNVDEPARSQWDIVMSPSGRIIGTAAAEPQVILWLREETAGIVTANNVTTVLTDGGTNDGNAKLVRQVAPGNHALVAIFTRTGRVQSSQPVFQALAPTETPAIYRAGGQYFDPRRYYDDILRGDGSGL